jgi:hypothetical protein
LVYPFSSTAFTSAGDKPKSLNVIENIYQSNCMYLFQYTKIHSLKLETNIS